MTSNQISSGPMLRILGICGSLRKASYNAMLLRAYRESAHPEASIETAHIDQIPLYNEDVRQGGFPPSVAQLRSQILGADALLIVTPEYNYSIPGVLKNAIDWASRPPEQPFAGKAIAVAGASPSMFGSARAQYDLRRCFVYLNAFVLNQPEVMIARAHERFDATGTLHDQGSQKLVVEQLKALARLAHLLTPGRPESPPRS